VRSIAAQLHDMRMDESNKTCDEMERELGEFHLNDDVDENPRKRKRRIPDYLRDEIVDEIEGKSICSVTELCELVLPMKKAFPSVYKLYAGALTFGASTALCEASFSVLTKLITKNANR